MVTNSQGWLDEAARLPLAFAQVREDALLDQYLVRQLPADARLIMVASGGCTAALLATLPNVARLHLVDPNPAQIALTRLKLHLLCTVGTEERLAILGHASQMPADRAAALQTALAALSLSPDILGPPAFVAEFGPDHAGRYERVFAELRRELSPHADQFADLCHGHGPVAQAARVAPDTKLGQALDAAFDKVMALPNLVRLFGEEATRNPCESFSRHFARRTRHALATMPAATNPYLGQVLLGRFPTQAVSPWLTAAAPARLPEITWSCTLMTDALQAAPAEFDFVHLSNILDWLSPERARATLELAWRALRPGGVVFIRQLNSSLDIPSLGGEFAWQAGEAVALHARDRSYFYRALHLGKKR